MKIKSTNQKVPVMLSGLLLVAALFLSVACTGPAGLQGPTGPQGTTGTDGAKGPAGAAGPAGSVGPAGAAGAAGAVGPAGAAGPVGAAGPQGPAGALPAGTNTGMNVTVMVSRPANNATFFAVGERPVVTVMLMDKSGKGLSMNDFDSLDLYMYGPQDPSKVVTAVKLIKASENRSDATHHYIHLIGNNSSDIKVSLGGMQIDYTLQPITTELPGTYTVALRVLKKSDTFNRDLRAFVLQNTQIGTATVENTTVAASKCAACHLGASNSQMYLHHTDPYRDLNGSPEIDALPIATCKACHNNNGYASFVQSNGTRIVDNIIIRVHGVHMGEELANPLNNDPATGSFKNYRELAFPQNAKNCTACHTDDAWKNKPSRLACGTCHDTTWFGDQTAIPAGYVKHDGGAQADDSKCTVCHTNDNGPISTVVIPIPTIHQVSQPLNSVNITLTPPANGNFYVAGEKPTLTLTIRNDSGTAVNPANIDAAFSAANLYVYGPRENAVPVLTNVATIGNTKTRASATSSIAGPWTFVAGDTFKISVNDGPVLNIAATAGNQTPAQVAALLQGALGSTVNVTSTATSVTIQDLLFGDASKIDIYNSALTTKMGWKPAGLPIILDGVTVRSAEGTTMEPYQVRAAVSTVAVNLRTVTPPAYADPNIVKNPTNITYQLLDVSGLQPGTYMVFSYVVPSGIAAGTGDGPTGAPNAAAISSNVSRVGIGFTTFQVGTATPSKKVATNCKDCHGSNIWHLDNGPIHPEPFDTDYCLACHDYGRMGTGEGYSRTGGTSTNGWAGYGAKPLVNRLHGVHFGAYLNRPEDVYAGNAYEFAGIIFPQDVRNCTKCHSADTTGTWKTAPSKLACMACHDSDAARAHGKLNTYDPTPNAPGSGDEVEACVTCHGSGKEFAPDVVHNISSPYVTPYPREGQVGNANASPSWKIGQ